ncbi:hypothetical protein HAX54_049359 [Datura stramonium]|uniref:Secreted protein n=1 Tax=Datura stramonium TaxID=4076 RepID=A0ABS8SUS8_DATST|nr:hypothetical protein [Datura stramonium]
MLFIWVRIALQMSDCGSQTRIMTSHSETSAHDISSDADKHYDQHCFRMPGSILCRLGRKEIASKKRDKLG